MGNDKFGFVPVLPFFVMTQSQHSEAYKHLKACLALGKTIPKRKQGILVRGESPNDQARFEG